MFIKKVEIFGFKSFKNKTVLEFDNHEITGIVGPNGCGKSNVVDALLWVMGENSPKHLRGESLSDVIFSGTAKEAPGNLAEVTLTLTKGSSGFPENYKDFSELMITRRTYRDDGKTECFINQQACLLKDIREFFMNTGAGCRGFSIIEQESIERLITAKPIQRRFIIEEAAGITKFKNRKSESVRKLDLVNQNLQRLDDILKMQESQLSSLTSQAKKAEKYRKLKQKIEDRSKQIEKREKENIFCTYQNLKKEQDSLRSEKSNKEKEVQTLEKHIKEEKNNLSETKKNLSHTKQREIEKKMEESSLLNKIKVFEMIENIKNKKQNLQEKEKTIYKELEQIQNFLDNKTDISEVEKEEKQVQADLEEIKQTKIEAETNVSILEKQIQFIEREKEKLLEEKKVLATQIQKNINEKNKFNSLFEKQRQMNLKFNKELNTISANEENLRNKKESLEEETNQLDQEVSLSQYKIEEMKKLISRFEAVNEGAVDLKKYKSEEFKSLFQNLTVDPDYAEALGSVLGHYIQALIPKEDLNIKEAIKYLKNNHKGKTSFLSSFQGSTVSTSSKKEIKTYPSFICFLDEKVNWNSHIEPLRPFLEQIVVVSDISSAFELKKQFPSFQFVTREGDTITRDSFVYAGSTEKETSLFKIRDQIDEHLKTLSTKKIELKIKKMDLDVCMKRSKQIKQDKQDFQNKNSQSSEKMISLKKDIEQTERDLLRLSENRNENNQKMKDFEKEKQNILQHNTAYTKEIQDLKHTTSLKQSRLKNIQTIIDEYKDQNLNKLQWERKLLENTKDQKGIDQEISLLLSLVDKDEKSKNTKRKNLSPLNPKEDIEVVYKQRQNLDTQLASFQKELEKQNQMKEKQERNIQDSETKLFQIKLDVNNLQLEWEKKDLEKGHIQNKFLESYQIQIEDFSPPSSSKEISLDKLKEELNHYEAQLDRTKEINFLALEEYEKLSKENFFLTTQKEDLVTSKKELIKVISHIDNLCETRFKDMLEEINKRFSKVFPIVFQGDNAKAQLILYKESEDKEPGVDILIHPPGKKPQSVVLLSRGEKALTSVCLIYSLFLVKPSPFCIIDEADAPLDDANILRFLSILKEMSQNSQIITITHNKYTMQACKKLYGVTLEQPGISQIVSVDMESDNLFSKAADNVSISPPDSL